MPSRTELVLWTMVVVAVVVVVALRLDGPTEPVRNEIAVLSKADGVGVRGMDTLSLPVPRVGRRDSTDVCVIFRVFSLREDAAMITILRKDSALLIVPLPTIVGKLLYEDGQVVTPVTQCFSVIGLRKGSNIFLFQHPYDTGKVRKVTIEFDPTRMPATSQSPSPTKPQGRAVSIFTPKVGSR